MGVRSPPPADRAAGKDRIRFLPEVMIRGCIIMQVTTTQPQRQLNPGYPSGFLVGESAKGRPAVITRTTANLISHNKELGNVPRGQPPTFFKI